jgi:SAM-dependent methyltransferase
VELNFCGDGDYRAIGAEFLGHFVRLADLRPDERLLDIGCGIGRMAVPLTQYLSVAGAYQGIDIVREGIAWCERTISPVYPNFRFQHLDLDHPLYNPGGTANPAAARLPFPDQSFDVICLVSVLTHLDTAALTNYAREVARLLAPGGRCFATAFLVNPPAREALRSGRGRLAFDPDAEGPEFYADPAAPLAAVAFDEDHLLERFLRFGQRRRRPAVYGCWSGRQSAVFQDICVFE